MIKSFRCRQTEKIFNMGNSSIFPRELHQRAYNKLRMLHNASTISDLRVPLSNNLEKLKGNKNGYNSLRINSQWRICFKWHDGDAYDVEIVDYH